MSLGNGAWKEGGIYKQTECIGYPWQPCEQQSPGTDTQTMLTTKQYLPHTYHEDKGDAWAGRIYCSLYQDQSSSEKHMEWLDIWELSYM